MRQKGDPARNWRSRALLTTAVVLLAAVCTGLAATSGAARASTVGPRAAGAVPVGRPVLGVPQFGPDIRVSASTNVSGTANRDYSMAVNPTNPNNVIASYDENTQSAYAASTDGGATWAQGVFQGPWGKGITPFGSTNVGFDANGTGYYASHAISSTVDAYFILTTTNGLTWGDPMFISENDNSVTRLQPYMVVDARNGGPFAGSLYIFWAYSDSIAPYNHGIRMRYSHDGGRTWSRDIQVSDTGHEISEGPFAVVASDGTVYVAFEEQDVGGIAEPVKLYLDRSTDGGATWGADMLIGGGPVVPIGAPDEKGRELVLNGSAGCTEIHINFFPSIAVSPTDTNTVYVTWNDGRFDQNFLDCDPTGRHSDVAFSRTSDGGLTWTEPSRVNDDPQGNRIDQFSPVMAMGPDGLIGITWYDRRYSADGYYYDVAYSQSTDGGQTWSANQRVSDNSSNPDEVPDAKLVDDLGERRGFVYGPDYVLPSWLNATPGSRIGDFFTDRGIFPPATPTPTYTPVPPTSTPCPLQFNDVPTTDPFYTYIRCLACRGIVSGYNDNTFRPGNNITRGQISKMVSGAAGYEDQVPSTQRTYTDVSSANTFWLWIERLTLHNVMSGYPCGGVGEPCDQQARPYFRWGANATRGQLSKIVAIADNDQTPIPSTQQTYEDVPNSNTFWLWIERLAQRGVMGGYTCGTPPAGQCVPPQNRAYFLPFNNVTRGQASKIVANTFYPNCQTPARP